MRPDLVCAEIRRVEVGFGGIEDHPVDAGVGRIFIVLDVALDGPVGVDGEHVAVTGIIVEGVSVNIVWWFLRRQDEDSSGVCVCSGCGC